MLFLNFLYGEESVGCYEATVTPFDFDITKDITTINFNKNNKWSISGQINSFVKMHNVKNHIGKPFVGCKIQNINLSKINDALLYLDMHF